MFSITEINPYILICVVLMLVWPYVRRNLLWAIAFNKLPGPSSIQQFRHFLSIMFTYELIDLAAAHYAMIVPHVKRYPLIGLGGGKISFVLLCKAEAVKVLLSSKTQLGKASLYKHASAIVGDGLATSKGAKWHQHRKLLTPAFFADMLENNLVVMNEQADILVHLLEKKSKQTDDTAFNICPYISRCSLDIICETAMRQSVNAQTETDSGFVKAIESLIVVLPTRFLNPWLWSDTIYRFTQSNRDASRWIETANAFPDKVIENKFKQFTKSNVENGAIPKSSDDTSILGKKRRLAMLDMLMEMSAADGGSGSPTLTEEDIRDEVRTFMIGGFETSFISISWVLYYIGRYPDVQQRIVDELNLVFGDSDRNSSSNDLNNLQYLDCVIKETLRLHPPLPLIGRHLTEEMSICGYTVPADTDVYMSTYWVQRDPAHYPDPDSFDPDRFLPENSLGRHPFAYIPFAAGLRNCIGQKYATMEVKVVLAAILRRFKVTALERDPTLSIIAVFITNPLQGVYVKLDSRLT